MNPYLKNLEQYPFERLDTLKSCLEPKTTQPHISLALGEPKHDPPESVVYLLSSREMVIQGLSSYPTTRGTLELRQAISDWNLKRYDISLDPDTQVLPVNGTREALFSFGQAVLSGKEGSRVVFPNPFYQIYEGAALLRGARPYLIPNTEAPIYQEVPNEIWEQTELVYICSPNNPSGHVMDSEDLSFLIHQALEYDFVIASDECYSEIYYDENHPPNGLLEVARSVGNPEFTNCVAFNSLSKRSNLPGLRSGFVAGDKALLAQYYQYRTYHGCAMSTHSQAASKWAWSDEAHVVENRAIYREKFRATRKILEQTLDIHQPEGGFYYWPLLPVDDQEFAAQLYVHENITVLPGSYLGRSFGAGNPGLNRVRLALVAPLEECINAITRLCEFLQKVKS